MAGNADKHKNSQRGADLSSALEEGAFSPRVACRLLRQIHGHSQAELAAMLGINIKVVKALESGKGNPSYLSVEKIAEAFGLAVVFIKKGAVAELMDVAARVQEKHLSRLADAAALASGAVSNRELNRKNALKIEHAGYQLPSLV